MKTSTIILSVILFIAIVLAVIFYSYWNQTQSQIQVVNLNISSSANIFDSQLHDLFDQNVLLLIGSTRRSLDSSIATNASITALQNNINEVGNLLTPIYGYNTSQQLVNLWNSKFTNVFLNYSIELKNNNSNANADFNTNAAIYEKASIGFWSNSSNSFPDFNPVTIQNLVSAQLMDVKVAIDAWNYGNYTNYYANQNLAYGVTGTFADTIAQGIIQQNSQDFQ